MTWNEYCEMVYQVQKEYDYYSYTTVHTDAYREKLAYYTEQKKKLNAWKRNILEKALTNLSKEDIIGL